MAGLKGLTRMPAACEQRQPGRHSSRDAARLAPPRARMVGVPSKPCHSVRVRASRPGRPGGAARRGAGARPSWPSERRGPTCRRRFRCRGHWPRRSAPRAERRGWRVRAGCAPRHSGSRNCSSGSECVRFSPPRPASRNLRAGAGMWSMDGDAVARLRENFRGHEARGARAGNGDWIMAGPKHSSRPSKALIGGPVDDAGGRRMAGDDPHRAASPPAAREDVGLIFTPPRGAAAGTCSGRRRRPAGTCSCRGRRR